MARRPARLERAGALTPRDRMWAAMRALAVSRDPDTEAWFSPAEVHFLVNVRAEQPVHVDSVISYLEGLAKAEPPYVALADGDRPAGRKRTELFLYRLVRDVGVEAPRVTRDGKPVTQGIGTERMWTAIKALREFDYLEIAQAATDESCTVRLEAAKTYLYYLERAGYVVLVSPCVRGAGHWSKARYRFIRAKNTGPRAPLITREKEVMDANTGVVVWPPKGEKACREQT